MKVAYVTNAKPENRSAWSGLSYYMRRSLELAGLEVEVIGSMSFPPAFWPERFVQVAADKTSRAPRRIWTFDPRVIQTYTRQMSAFQQTRECVDIDDRPARRIHHHRAPRQQR